MIQNLLWASGYNALAIPLAAGVLYNHGILLSPAIGALIMSLSTVVVALNSQTPEKGDSKEVIELVVERKKDPVYGMEVDPREAHSSLEYEGKEITSALSSARRGSRKIQRSI